MNIVDYKHQYYLDHKEKYSERSLKWKKEHPERTKEINNKWRANNADKMRSYERDYYHRVTKPKREAAKNEKAEEL